MAKRFTDSDKWQDPWFSDLPNKYKLFYLYLLDSCDHAGIWKVNFKIARFMIGEDLEPSEVKRVLNERLIYISDEYWFVKKFIQFQYGGIRTDSVGKSVVKLLKKYGLEDILNELTKLSEKGANKPLQRGYEGTKDKDKVKAKDKAKDKAMDMDKDIKSESPKNLDSLDISDIQKLDREILTDKQFDILHRHLSELAVKLGEVMGFTNVEVKSYIDNMGASLWQFPSGKYGKTKISSLNIRSDMSKRKNGGWLKVDKTETENTYDPGALN